jgi:hypothetical protein
LIFRASASVNDRESGALHYSTRMETAGS